MFKTLKVLAVLLAVVIGVVHGQSDSNGNTVSSPNDSDNNVFNNPTEASTDVSTTESPIGNILYIFDGDLLSGILDGLVASPLGIIFRPLSVILRPIFSGIDTLMSPMFWVIRNILGSVTWFMNMILRPVNGVSSIVSWVTSIVSLIVSNLSGISSVALTQSTNRRKRRGIMDSMMGMAWTTLSNPFRFVYDIISTILSPFYYFYKTVTWPLHFIFGGDADSDISTSIATVTSFLPFSDTISALLLKLSDSSQEAIIELMKYLWARTKEYLLPAVDEFIVGIQDSDYVPNDIKSGLSAVHSAYSMLHMFGIL